MRNVFMIAVLFVMAGLYALRASASVGDGWNLERDRDGIRVYTRAVPGSKYREFRGEAEVDAELNQVMAVLNDTDACVDWMYKCVQPKMLQKVSLLDRYQYLVNDFPWPAADRALVIRNRISQDEDTRVTKIDLDAMADSELPERARGKLPEAGENVRVTDARGFFELTPLEGERTRVVYQLHLDPVGSLPSGLVNALIVDNPFETLKNIRDVVKRPQYQSFKPF